MRNENLKKYCQKIQLINKCIHLADNQANNNKQFHNKIRENSRNIKTI